MQSAYLQSGNYNEIKMYLLIVLIYSCTRYMKCVNTVFGLCSSECIIPIIIFLTFSADGDNTSEAKAMAEICDGLVQMVCIHI